jgi:ferrous iron transport protein B
MFTNNTPFFFVYSSFFLNFVVANKNLFYFLMRLSDLEAGQSGVVVKILGHGAFRKRVMEMGFVKGRKVSTLLYAPLRDPVKYSILGYEVSLRRSEAQMIEIVAVDDDYQPENDASHDLQYMDVDDSDDIRTQVVERGHTINVALIGNPNCGKTSLFNAATHGKEHVGNYSGVTVDAKEGKFKYRGYRFNVIDLPGTYSLASYSPEELYVRHYLREQTPDVIINVVDASNLERNLYLTTELIDMDRSMVIALNMFDELRNSGSRLDYKLLGDMIGVPIIPTISKRGEGLDELFDTVIDVFEGKHQSVRHIHIPLGTELENAVSVIKNEIKKDGDIAHHISPRYFAIKLLEKDPETVRFAEKSPKGQQLLALRDKALTKLQNEMNEDVNEIIAAEKYGFIDGALAETMVKNEVKRVTPTSLIDAWVTNKLFGFPLFFLVMFLTFWLTFSLGQYPMDWIQSGVDWLADFVHNNMPDGPLKDLITDGVIGGVGGVIVFLPNILILYFCISFMEDSGYMARAAFIMDRIMHRMGLHGKSFIPLVMGFGCNVPAVMSSRTIESHSSRLITILLIPFMSCSARVPIYVLLVGAFFPDHAAIAFMGFYVLGIIIALITARLLRRFLFKKDETPFVMELPPYRLPTLKSSLHHMWNKGEQYLRKMGGVILVAAIIVWVLNYFPRHSEPAIADAQQTEIVDDTSVNSNTDSFLEMAGKVVNPIMEPLGFHWRATVAVLAGIPAKEIIVSTLGVLYANDENVSDASLGERLAAPNTVTGKPDFNWASALSFLVFILLYCPCIATLTAIVRETGSWKYGAFSVIYNTIVAWIGSFVVYHIALLFM